MCRTQSKIQKNTYRKNIFIGKKFGFMGILKSDYDVLKLIDK